MDSTPIYQVDAFTRELFRGNPAAVCPLDHWLSDPVLQSIAAENNLSETAFFVRSGTDYDLRWFTPVAEVDLCGHATLASAFVVFKFLEPEMDAVRFHSKSGRLTVTRDDDRGPVGRLCLDFPAQPAIPEPIPDTLGEALGVAPEAFLANRRDHLVILPRERDVRAVTPDFRLLSALARPGTIVTAPGDSVDFVSRFFAPALGAAEDPVTGSAHCALVPYWSERLGKTMLEARQVSARGGELSLELAGDRVKIRGYAVLYLEGSLCVPTSDTTTR